MMTGRLVESKGSLARAVLPFVFHLKWGWHRVERAMERGKVPLDELFDLALEWCFANLPVEPIYIGTKKREVNAIDSSTIARWRAQVGMDLLGKGYYHRAGKAVKSNIVAVVTTIVIIAGVRVGLVRRVRFGTSCESAVANVFEDLPQCQHKRLLVVDAGIATQEQFAASTEQNALVGRLRINCKLRCAPVPKEKGKRGRPPKHGAVLHPGSASPESAPTEDFLDNLDRGFYSSSVIRWLKALDIPFIMPAIKNGISGGINQYLKGQKSYQTTHTMNEGKDNEVTFPLWIVCKYRKGKRGKYGIEYECLCRL